MPEDAPWGMPQARSVGQAALMSLRGHSGPLGDVGVSASSLCCWACPAGPLSTDPTGLQLNLVTLVSHRQYQRRRDVADIPAGTPESYFPC